MTFDELAPSRRQIDGQRAKGQHPPDFHFRSKPFLHSATVPAGPTPTSRSAGLRAGHRINAEATRGSAGAGERARRRRARVPTAAARGRGERTDRTPICASPSSSSPSSVKNATAASRSSTTMPTLSIRSITMVLLPRAARRGHWCSWDLTHSRHRKPAGFHDLLLAVTPWAAHTAGRGRIKLREFRACAA
jgi:hypothetical protein